MTLLCPGRPVNLSRAVLVPSTTSVSELPYPARTSPCLSGLQLGLLLRAAGGFFSGVQVTSGRYAFAGHSKQVHSRRAKHQHVAQPVQVAGGHLR